MTTSTSSTKNVKKTPLLNSEDGNGLSDMDTYQEQERVVTPFPNPDESINVTKDGVQFPQNIIVTTRYTMLSFFPKSLFEQFRRLANVYFLVLGCIAAIGMATEYYDTAVEPAGLLIPLTIVVLISVAKDGIEDTKRNKADNRTNSRATRVVSSDGSVHEIQWRDIVVGTVLLLQSDDEVPADAVVLGCGGLQGPSAYVETAAIDGETNLKLRLPALLHCNTGSCEAPSLKFNKNANSIAGLSEVKTIFHVELPNSSIHSFNGSMECEYSRGEGEEAVRSEVTLSEKNLCLRGSVIRASEWVVCVVVYTGRDTKLSRNSKSPPSKLSVVDSVVNRTLAIAIGVMVLICCLSALLAMYWQEHNSEADYLCLHEGDQDNAYTSDTGCESGATSSTLLMFTFATLYNNFVAISMYVSLEMVYLWQAYFISQDLSMYDSESDSPAEAHTSGMCADLGQVQYVLSDKTGTLTRNVMCLRRCSVAGMLYGSPASLELERDTTNTLGSKSNPSSKFSFSDSMYTAEQADHGLWTPLSSLSRFRFLPDSPDNNILASFMRNLAVCNSVMLMPNQATGDLDVTDKESLKACLEAESPDEVALVLGAADADVILVKRDSEVATVASAASGQPREMIKILAVNEFDSRRKCMSVVVRVAKPAVPSGEEREGTGEKEHQEVEWGPPVLLCKGADSSVFSACGKGGYLDICKVHVDDFACTGLRTLVMAQRVLSEGEFEAWIGEYRAASKSLCHRQDMLRRCAESIERDMDLLGAVGIEDELQAGVPHCVDLLSKAGVNLWMITGDKPETAVAIGRMCGLLRPQHELETLVKGPGTSEPESLHLRLAGLLLFFEKKRQHCPVEGGDSPLQRAWMSFRQLFSQPGGASNSSDLREQPCTPSTTPSRTTFTKLSYADDPTGTPTCTMTADRDTAATASSDATLRDSRPTAAYVRHSLSAELALIIDGSTLEEVFADEECLSMFRTIVRDMSTVIACRVSPLQKASLVRMIKTGPGKPVTLAIGDGANDIGMINEAKVGVGICGKEGRHAANSADFAIGQFRFLAPLMLKHGRYNYIRCSKLVLYCFFKNLVLVSSLFYFCIYSGFSGTMPLDSIIFSGFNFYLGLPILCVGVFDVDVPYELVVKYPYLAYATGRKREMLNLTTMLRWCLLAFAEGLVLFALVIRVIGGSTNPRMSESDGHSLQGVGLNSSEGKAGGIYAEGFLLYSCVILAMVYKVATITCTWNAFHFWSHLLSMWGFLLFVYVYSRVEQIPDFYEVTEFTLALPNYWLAMLMVPVCLCIMDSCVEWLFAQCFPTSRDTLKSRVLGGTQGRTLSCDESESAFAGDESEETGRKSAKSIKLTTTSSENGDFAY